MRVKVTIETWNDEWRLEIEDEDDGETLNAGYYPTFEQCMSECKRYLSQLSAAEQSVQADGACAHPRKYRLPSGRLFCPDCDNFC